jgi:pimeloyl-ACP methyl ester carboxylesterase
VPKPLTILHGALGCAAQFTPLVDELQRVWGIHAHVIEFVGHGNAAPVESFSIERFVQQVTDSRNAGECAEKVFGYSMGGYVAMAAELAQKGLFSAVCTLGTKVDWNPAMAERETARLEQATLEAKVPTFAAYLQKNHGNNYPAILTNTARMMTALASAPTLSVQSIATIGIPVQFMVGDSDEMVRIDETMMFAQAAPKSTFAVLPGTRHPIENVNVPLLAAIIANWYNR